MIPAAPPQNLEAERSVLGAVLLSDSCLPALAAGGLAAGEFYRESHGRIYQAMLDLHTQGEPVDSLTLVEHLKRAGDLESVGGAAAIELLVGSVPVLGNLHGYARIVRELARERLENAAALELASARNGTRESAREALLAALSTPGPESRHRGRRQDFAALRARAEAEPPYRVKPLAVDGHLTVLAATGGDGKTWLGFGMAAGVAHGRQVAGMGCTPGRAVIFDAENGPWVLGSRLKALEEGMPPDRVAIYDAEGLRLTDPADREWILKTIREEGADLAIIDALRPLAPDAEENSSDSMAPVVIGAKQLARESGAAVVLLHHRGADASRDFRGSTAIRDQADLLFVLERDEKDPERRWRRRLRCAKYRIGPEPDDIWFGIRGHRGYVTLTEAAPPDAATKPNVKLDLADRILGVLGDADGPLSQGAIARALDREKGDRTVRRALDLLRENGAVVGTADGYVQGWQTAVATPDTPPPSGGVAAALSF